MIDRGRAGLLCLSSLMCLAACSPSAPPQENAPFEPVYEGIDTRLLDGDLVSFQVRMRGARDTEDVRRYADCAAAQYALIRGFGYARHLRTTTDATSGLWQADAVYTISAERPAGLLVLNADDVVAGCRAEGVPTV
ncbi:MAG: hypothetical protein AAGF50_12850 [Pseudomonadota bacterium]